MHTHLAPTWSSACRDWRLFFQTFQPSFVISWPTRRISLVGKLEIPAKRRRHFCFRVTKGTNDSAVFRGGVLTLSAQFPRIRTCSGQINLYSGEIAVNCTDVQLSIVRLSNLTKRKSSWRLKTHWDPCDRSPPPPPHRNEFGLSEISVSVSARLTQVADRRKSLAFSQTFLRSFCPVKAKISFVTRRGCRAEKILVGMMFFCPQEKEKTKKEVVGEMRQTTLTGEVAPQGPRERGIPLRPFCE